jgi:hypothetical protein
MDNLNFEKNLLEAVDHGLLSLGENPRKAIYFHLKRSFQLQRESIPKETDEFSRALNTIFGPGAEVIEKYILKELYQRLELNFEEKVGLTFADYVREAKKLVGRKKQGSTKSTNLKILEEKSLGRKRTYVFGRDTYLA